MKCCRVKTIESMIEWYPRIKEYELGDPELQDSDDENVDVSMDKQSLMFPMKDKDQNQAKPPKEEVGDLEEAQSNKNLVNGKSSNPLTQAGSAAM